MADGGADLTLFDLLAGAELLAVTDEGAGWRLRWAVPPALAGLPAPFDTLVTGDPTFRPWLDAAEEALPQMLADQRLTLLGRVPDPERLAFAVRATKGEGLAMAGGSAFAGGRLLTMAAGGGPIAPATLIAAAQARIATAMAHPGAPAAAARTIVADRLAPLLHAAGFRGRGTWFVRPGPVTHAVEVEHGRWNTPLGARVTLAVVASVGRFARPPGRTAFYAAGPAIRRPLSVLTGGSPLGHRAAAGDDPAAVAAQLTAELVGLLLPWCAATATPDALIAWLDADDAAAGTHANAYITALLLLRLDRRDAALAHFRIADGDPATIAATARAHGLDW